MEGPGARDDNLCTRGSEFAVDLDFIAIIQRSAKITKMPSVLS